MDLVDTKAGHNGHWHGGHGQSSELDCANIFAQFTWSSQNSFHGFDEVQCTIWMFFVLFWCRCWFSRGLGVGGWHTSSRCKIKLVRFYGLVNMTKIRHSGIYVIWYSDNYPTSCLTNVSIDQLMAAAAGVRAGTILSASLLINMMQVSLQIQIGHKQIWSIRCKCHANTNST